MMPIFVMDVTPPRWSGYTRDEIASSIAAALTLGYVISRVEATPKHIMVHVAGAPGDWPNEDGMTRIRQTLRRAVVRKRDEGIAIYEGDATADTIELRKKP